MDLGVFCAEKKDLCRNKPCFAGDTMDGHRGLHIAYEMEYRRPSCISDPYCVKCAALGDGRREPYTDEGRRGSPALKCLFR